MEASLNIDGLDKMIKDVVENSVIEAVKPLIEELTEVKKLLQDQVGLSDDTYLSKKEVAKLIGTKSKNGAYINELIKKGRFPKPDKYEGRYPRWRFGSIPLRFKSSQSTCGSILPSQIEDDYTKNTLKTRSL